MLNAFTLRHNELMINKIIQDYEINYNDFALAQRSVWALEQCEQEICTHLLLSLDDHNLILHKNNAYLTPQKLGTFISRKFKKFIVNYNGFFKFFEKILNEKNIIFKNYVNQKNINISKINNEYILSFGKVSLKNINFKDLILNFQKRKLNKKKILLQDVVFRELNLIKTIFEKLPLIIKNYMRKKGKI